MSEGSMKLIVSENGESREVDLTGSVLEIGRGSENQVVIKDPRSSRRHCRVRQTPQGWILEDLKSRNGTTLNGSSVAQNLLKSGDEFRIGNARFRFEGAVASVPVSSPPGAASSPLGPPEGKFEGAVRLIVCLVGGTAAVDYASAPESEGGAEAERGQRPYSPDNRSLASDRFFFWPRGRCFPCPAGTSEADHSG
jgi:hypothetical protein